MAGRGGSRGGGSGGRPSTSLTAEQLQSLGVVAKDMSNTITAPPPIFPTLMSKPVPLETSAARDYKILWKEDFISILKDSPYYTHPSGGESKIQRYSDKYIRVLTKTKDKNSGDYAWNQMPADLKPNWKRKKDAASDSGLAKKKKINVNIDEKLKVLEEKEQGIQQEKAGVKNETDDDDEVVDEEQADEEMDEDNDYGNSYFDNGDAYNEEDDNLDDGPVY